MTTPFRETADGETTLTDYSSSIECKASNGTGAVVASGTGTGPVTVNVTDGSDIVCTITNTRKTGKIEVVKKINPTTDPGRFDLRIDNTVQKDEAAHNDTTGEKTLNTGDHTVSRDGRRRDDADRLLVEHRVQGEQRHRRGRGLGYGTGAGDRERHRLIPTSSARSPTPARPASSRSSRRSTRRPTPGRFDLRIDNAVQKDEAAHNDTTGEKTAQHR